MAWSNSMGVYVSQSMQQYMSLPAGTSAATSAATLAAWASRSTVCGSPTGATVSLYSPSEGSKRASRPCCSTGKAERLVKPVRPSQQGQSPDQTTSKALAGAAPASSHASEARSTPILSVPTAPHHTTVPRACWRLITWPAHASEIFIHK